MRDFADWCNLDVRHIGRLDDDRYDAFRAQIGEARISIQQMIAYVPEGGDREKITAEALRRFGHTPPIVGSGPELVDHFSRLQARGVERVYAWFCDFAQPDTLAGFGDEVINKIGVKPAATVA